jgi:hypothetical protein
LVTGYKPPHPSQIKSGVNQSFAGPADCDERGMLAVGTYTGGFSGKNPERGLAISDYGTEKSKKD